MEDRPASDRFPSPFSGNDIHLRRFRDVFQRNILYPDIQQLLCSRLIFCLVLFGNQDIDRRKGMLERQQDGAAGRITVSGIRIVTVHQVRQAVGHLRNLDNRCHAICGSGQQFRDCFCSVSQSVEVQVFSRTKHGRRFVRNGMAGRLRADLGLRGESFSALPSIRSGSHGEQRIFCPGIEIEQVDICLCIDLFAERRERNGFSVRYRLREVLLAAGNGGEDR